MKWLRHHYQWRANRKESLWQQLTVNNAYKSDQMVTYYSFQRNLIKWGKKTFFQLSDLPVMNDHSLHSKMNHRKILLEIFYEEFAEVMLEQVFHNNPKIVLQADL